MSLYDQTKNKALGMLKKPAAFGSPGFKPNAPGASFTSPYAQLKMPSGAKALPFDTALKKTSGPDERRDLGGFSGPPPASFGFSAWEASKGAGVPEELDAMSALMPGNGANTFTFKPDGTVEDGNYQAYLDKIVEAARSGVISQYDAQLATINMNLQLTMAQLDAEKATLEPVYQDTLKTIAKNQFSSAEAAKEMMNQSGWNTQNSGLAVGEQTKVVNQANDQRTDAQTTKERSVATLDAAAKYAKLERDLKAGILSKSKKADLAAVTAAATEKAVSTYGTGDYSTEQVNKMTRTYRAEMMRMAKNPSQVTPEEKTAMQAYIRELASDQDIPQAVVTALMGLYTTFYGSTGTIDPAVMAEAVKPE
jgi:hypothetical protein